MLSLLLTPQHALMLGACFVRRLSKRFGIHVKDKEVHNVSK